MVSYAFENSFNKIFTSCVNYFLLMIVLRICCQLYNILVIHCLSFTLNTVDQVIFAGLNFREFLILALFTKFRIREFSFPLVALV